MSNTMNWLEINAAANDGLSLLAAHVAVFGCGYYIGRRGLDGVAEDFNKAKDYLKGRR